MRLSLREPTPPSGWRCGPGWCRPPPPRPGAGWPLSGVVVAAVRTGITARLAAGEATAAKVAADLGLDPLPTRLLLDCLRSAGHVTERSGRYRLSRDARRWLDPASPLSVAAYVAGAADYWPWWEGLEQAMRTGKSSGSHDAPPDDPYWRRYIAGQRELARLSAAEVAKKLPLPRRPRALLDIGGGHGWYSACLCRRHPGLTATVLDLPGSAAVGREIIAAAGLPDRVLFRDGDATTADLGGGYDAVLCFNLVHHLDARAGRRPVPPGPRGAEPRRHAGRPRRLRRAGPPRGRARRHARPVRLPQLGRPGAHAGAARRLAARRGLRPAEEDQDASHPGPDAAGREKARLIPNGSPVTCSPEDPAAAVAAPPAPSSGTARHRGRAAAAPSAVQPVRRPGADRRRAAVSRHGRADGCLAVPPPRRRAAEAAGGGSRVPGGSGPTTALSTCEFGTDSMPSAVDSRT